MAERLSVPMREGLDALVAVDDDRMRDLPFASRSICAACSVRLYAASGRRRGPVRRSFSGLERGSERACRRCRWLRPATPAGRAGALAAV